MMYVGSSLGRCLRSILSNEVSEDEVLLIVTRTMSSNLDDFIGVVKKYYYEGNYGSEHSYDMSFKSWEEVKSLAERLYLGGKIHQPRNFGDFPGGFLHPDLNSDIWVEVSPKSYNATPAVKQAYEHYRMLDELTR
jgi:hypothetical protein